VEKIEVLSWHIATGKVARRYRGQVRREGKVGLEGGILVRRAGFPIEVLKGEGRGWPEANVDRRGRLQNSLNPEGIRIEGRQKGAETADACWGYQSASNPDSHRTKREGSSRDEERRKERHKRRAVRIRQIIK